MQAIDGQVHGTITHAKATTCADCNEPLDFKEVKDSGGTLEAEHHGRKYVISPTQFVVNIGPRKEEEEGEEAKKGEKKAAATTSSTSSSTKTTSSVGGTR